MPLYFRCKSCGAEHLSPIVFNDRNAFEKTHLSRNTFECPRNRMIARYDREDLFWKVDLSGSGLVRAPDPRSAVHQTSLESARILMLDDEPATLRFLEVLLQHAGYREISALTDPRRVVEVFDAFSPDIVLLDLQMPHLDGFAVLERLRPRIGGAVPVPVVVLTGEIEPEAKQRVLAEGASDFLSKPFDSVEVLLRVKNLLETRMLHRELQRQVQLLESELRARDARDAGGTVGAPARGSQ